MQELIPKNKILLVEDEPHLAFHLEFNLQAEGYEVVPARTGTIALEKFRNNGPFSLIILDVQIPEIDGYTVARTIRAKDTQTGILMLTARASEGDRIRGLEAGVDDYITKPFHLQELLLRVKRMAQRSKLFSPPKPEADPDAHILSCGPVKLDTEALKLSSPTGDTSITALEADILKEFMINPGRVLSREYLLKKVWGLRGNIETRTVDNSIMRLRRYIEVDPTNPMLLESVRGRGYRLNSSDPRNDRKA